MSRIAARIQPLAQLEAAAIARLEEIHQAEPILESVRDQETSRQAAAVINQPSIGFATKQRKYADDIMNGTASFWKRVFLKVIYFPFTRFCATRLKIFPPSGRDSRGDLFYIEDQGFFFDHWRAVQNAAQYKFGYLTKLPCDFSVESETCLTLQQFPNSDSKRMRNGQQKVVYLDALDVEALRHVTEEAGKLVARHSKTSGDGK